MSHHEKHIPGGTNDVYMKGLFTIRAMSTDRLYSGALQRLPGISQISEALDSTNGGIQFLVMH